MAKKLMKRQGDLLFIQIEKLPERKLKKGKGNILVRGESTGHAHRVTIKERKAKNVFQILRDWRGRLYLQMNVPG